MAANSCQHVFSICSRLLARAVAACRPTSNLQAVQQIAVTLRNQRRIVTEPCISVKISDTGKALPDDIKVLKSVFNALFVPGLDGICDQQVLVKSTEMHETSIRAYKVNPGGKGADSPMVSVVRLPVSAKQSRLPFAGSEVTFKLSAAVNAEDVVSCVQALLELSSMVAPRMQLELRLKGFTLQGDEEEGKPRNVTMKYDIEPLPFDLSPEQRFFEGLKAWFEDHGCSQQQPFVSSEHYKCHDYASSAPLHQPLQPEHEAVHGQQLYMEEEPVTQRLNEDELHGHLSSYTDQSGLVGTTCEGPEELQYVSDCNMALEQPYLTEQMVKDQYLAADYDMPADQHDPGYAYHDQEMQQGMQSGKQQVELPGYQQQEANYEGMWAESQSISYFEEQGELDLRATSDDLHDTAWHSHGVQPCDITSIQYFPEDHHDMMYEDSEPMSHGLASKPPLAIAIGQAGGDAPRAGPGTKQQGVMLQRSKWTAHVGLVLHSQVPSPLAGYVLPQGSVQVYLFQNYALLQRPSDSCLKVLDKFAWQGFGLKVQVQALLSGAITLTFGPKSDALAQDISALIIHLYTGDSKQELSSGKAPALAAVTEAKLIKVALEDALSKLKAHFQGSLCNKAEGRLQECLPYLAKSLSKLVANSDNPDLQSHACQLMSCKLDSLQQELELRLQDAAAAELYWAAG